MIASYKLYYQKWNAYIEKEKDATNYDIFLHILYVCTGSVTRTHDYERMKLVRYQLLHPDMILRNVRDLNS